ncbi:hypothetical protein PB1_12799 [Bacillus methanolicus PB1]|uniref:Uncharacterized protein n=1 Tax=Bacillus methanolicus PB1 TaxID=997296 RepID=I3DW17_BACMT|nr:hypothetical protein PB1_12799 [Bacillus methanolicus PB1]
MADKQKTFYEEVVRPLQTELAKMKGGVARQGSRHLQQKPLDSGVKSLHLAGHGERSWTKQKAEFAQNSSPSFTYPKRGSILIAPKEVAPRSDKTVLYMHNSRAYRGLFYFHKKERSYALWRKCSTWMN